MKKRFVFLSLLTVLFAFFATAQDKSKRPSPPATVNAILKSGATVKIDYSRPSLKGRTIGKEIEPKDGQIWRTGANEATIFETDKDIKVEGKTLPAGKYALFTLVNGDEWTIIFNKTWKQWGAYDYKQADDALRVQVKAKKSATTTEQFLIQINENGAVSLLWGNTDVVFKLQ